MQTRQVEHNIETTSRSSHYQTIVGPISGEEKMMKVEPTIGDSVEMRVRRQVAEVAFGDLTFRAFIRNQPLVHEGEPVMQFCEIRNKLVPVKGPFLAPFKRVDTKTEYSLEQLYRALCYHTDIPVARQEIADIKQLDASLRCKRENIIRETLNLPPKAPDSVQFVPFKGMFHTAKQAISASKGGGVLFVNDRREFRFLPQLPPAKLLSKLYASGWWISKAK